METTRYYIRSPGSSDFQGPFRIDQIKEQLSAARLTREWEAIVATGQFYGQLRRATGWVKIELLVGNDGHQNPGREALPNTSFSCVGCDVQIRLQLREADFRCPRCEADYTIKKVSQSPLAFLIVPRLEHLTSPSARPRRRNCPPEVKAALSVFGLDEATSLERIRQAYRELVVSYHPDKVAHLGSELRRLAETKTKEINSAFSILEKFYTS